MTAKGSNRTLDPKTQPNIVNPGHATQHRTEAIWKGNRRVTHLGCLTQRHTSVVSEILRVLYKELIRHDFRSGSAWCIAILPLTSRPQEKMLHCKVGRADDGPCLDQRTMESSPKSSKQKRCYCKKGRVVLRPSLVSSPLDLSPRSSEQEENVLQSRTRRSWTPSGQEPAGLESEVVRTGAVSENVFSCFQSRCAANIGPKVEQPRELMTDRGHD